MGGGHHPSQGLYERAPSRKENSRARKRFGLEDQYAAEQATLTIAKVALEQARSLQTEAAKQSEELFTELKLRGIEFRAAYLEALAEQRQALIDAEIEARLKAVIEAQELAIREEQEILILLMIAAAAVQ